MLPEPARATHLQRLEARGHWGIKCGLENPRALLQDLGHPERAFPTVEIAGTNGKGSTGAFLANALRAAGYRVGWTTSPHLISPVERIWVDGAFVDEPALDRLLGEAFAAEVRAGIQATYFELMITAAVLAFQERAVDIAIIEAGLGGRWDATNALDPIVTVLTNVGIDHEKYLGSTREAIAREKLCTARDGRPLVLGPGLEPDWIRPLLECAPLLFPAPALTADQIAWDHSLVQGHRIGLAGAHQLQNLAAALETLGRLRSLGFNLPAQEVWEGLGRTRWPGRMWAIPGLDQTWADGAHNQDGARAAAQHIRACGVHPHLFFGVMADKDIPGMAASFTSTQPRSVTLVKGDNERYASAETLRAAWGTELEVLDLQEAARRLRQPAEGVRLVTGSLFFIGDLLRTLGITPQI
jgi:dihydrofolate synthase / folylpolyglutamate synthase